MGLKGGVKMPAKSFSYKVLRKNEEMEKKKNKQ